MEETKHVDVPTTGSDHVVNSTGPMKNGIEDTTQSITSTSHQQAFDASSYLKKISAYTSDDLMKERDADKGNGPMNILSQAMPKPADALSQIMDPGLSDLKVNILDDGRIAISSALMAGSDASGQPTDILQITEIGGGHKLDGTSEIPTGVSSIDVVVPMAERTDIPYMNIVMLVVGSHGDVQPFVAIGMEMKKYGHRVRIATHETFRKFVSDNGLEFYPLAGDPKTLMEYMVRTGGKIIPGSLNELYNDVPEKTKLMKEICFSTWGACTQAAPGEVKPFMADAIIANPPSYGGPHCAEALNIPLHMMFTLPWSPTREFGHPFFTFSDGTGTFMMPKESLNAASYYILEGLIWEGLGAALNSFRASLQLPLLTISGGASTFLFSKKLPFTYLWSPAFVPKPRDWGSNVDIVGFCLLEGSGMADWKPDQALVDFIASGDKPIFIGFGSCIIGDPKAASLKIFEALKRIGRRGIIQDGWSGLGRNVEVPSHIYVVGKAPHTWIFKHCIAACHHGGAGTTASSLLAGLPTIVCPFFGDQPFWGERVCAAKAGPAPVRIATATIEELAEAFDFACQPEASVAAKVLGSAMLKENGPHDAMVTFHHHMVTDQLCCDINAKHVAKIYCSICRMRFCLSCDFIVHETHRAHRRTKYRRHIDYGNKNSSLTAAFISAGTSFLDSMGTGVISLVTYPVKDIRRYGPLGLITGAIKGVAKCMAGIIGGCAVFVDEVGAGLVAVANKATGGPPQHLNCMAPFDMDNGSHVRNFDEGLIEGTKHIVYGITAGISDLLLLPAAGVLRGQSGLESTYLGVTGLSQAASSFLYRPLGGVLRGAVAPVVGAVRWLHNAIDGAADNRARFEVTTNSNEKAETMKKYEEIVNTRKNH